MFNDWQLHPQSVNNYQTGIFSPVPPPAGSVNAYRVSSATDSAIKRLVYVNKIAGTVGGEQELQGVFKLFSGTTDVRLGIFCMWDGLDFEDTENAHVVEWTKAPADSFPRLVLRNGTSRSSPIVAQTPPLFFNAWVQFALQIKFDQQYNSELRVYAGDPNVDPVTTPMWGLSLGPIVIPRADSKVSGQFGFFVESQQAVFNSFIDHVVMNTTLTI